MTIKETCRRFVTETWGEVKKASKDYFEPLTNPKKRPWMIALSVGFVLTGMYLFPDKFP